MHILSGKELYEYVSRKKSDIIIEEEEDRVVKIHLS